MNKLTLRNDIQTVLKDRGITLHRLASESGVEAASLWRFVNNENANLSTDSLFRLWPHVYGAQKPLPLSLAKVSSICGAKAPSTAPEGHEVDTPPQEGGPQ